MKKMAFFCIAMLAFSANASADSAAQLLAKYQALLPKLQQNVFKQPLVLDSVETQNKLTGDVHAVVAYPFSVVRSALNNPEHWCDVLSLHFNTKYCRSKVTAQGSQLMVRMGKKTPQALSQTEPIAFDYAATHATPQYMRIQLEAKDGPLGTSDYQIVLEAVPLPNGSTFLHLAYSYDMGLAARMATKTYLLTIGRGKQGFTEVGKRENGAAIYIGGERGVAERNIMRYYLAIDALLVNLRLPVESQFESRLQTWFAATERYAPQLHELDRDAYLVMKRAEHARELQDVN